MYICNVCKNNNAAGARFCSWCGTMISGQEAINQSATGLLPSQSVLGNGHYAVLKRVGQGGMGAVYKAQDLLLNKRIVAIKEMSQNGLAGQELQKAIAAFTHEAEILSHLKHQSLPRVYETFEENGRYYLVMDFIEGRTLEYILEKLHDLRRRLSIEKVLDIGKQLCAVLSYLHTQQPPVIFRDLKPANIMLDAYGHVYLIDFGIARLFKQGQLKDTTALGSAGYAPPEQYRHATSPRSDIYSLGATLHQILTGDDPSETPFQFQSFSINHPHLERLIMSMVALDEKQRPASMNEVLKGLDNITRPQQKQPITSTQSHAESKSIGLIPVSPPIASSITIYAVLSSSHLDQKLWASLKSQLTSELHLFPNFVIKEKVGNSYPKGTRLLDDVETRFITSASMILLLLSEDFLSTSECLAIANKAIDQSMEGRPLLGVLLRPCSAGYGTLSTNPSVHRLAHIRTIPKDAIAHLSVYAQERNILEVSREIRKHLTTLTLRGNKGESMTLLQWLLALLNGHHSCPYFIVGHYALEYIRTSGFGAGVVIHLLDLQHYRTAAVCSLGIPTASSMSRSSELAEYIVGSPDRRDLTSLLQTIAPPGLTTSPETVQGVAVRDFNGEEIFLQRTVASRDRKYVEKN